jgi:membrane protein required for colicin V production
MSSFNWFDVVLAVIVIAAVVGGVRRGFARMAIGLVSLVVAVIAACWFYGSAGSLVADYVSHKAIANLLGFAVVFGLVMAVGAAAGWLLDRLIRFAGLSWANRLAGAAMGMLHALIVGMAIVTALMAFSRKPPPDAVAGSRLAPFFVEASRTLAAMAPRELQDGFNKSYEEVKKIWNETLNHVRKLPARSF